MTRRLEGKAAAVTGSGRGIGRATAMALAAEGAQVVVNDPFLEADGSSAAEKVVAEIMKAGGSAVASRDSVTTMVGGRNIIEAAVTNFGSIDILVNCAGNYKVTSVHEITEQDWNSIVDVHLKGHFACTRAAIPHMMRRMGGRIVNFSSTGAFRATGSLPYVTAKAGIMGFTAMLSKELRAHGITVNAILPSAVTQLFPGLKTQRGADNLPTPEREGPDFIAPVIVYLATEEARDITGRFIYVSGENICLFSEPLHMASAPTYLHNATQWSVDELREVIPALLGAG